MRSRRYRSHGPGQQRRDAQKTNLGRSARLDSVVVSILHSLPRVSMGYAAALFAAFVISGIAPFSVGHLEAQEIPEGLDEGLFEIRASHLPALTSLVLITPRGAVLLPLTSVLELTGIPFERTPSGALLSLSRPAGIGTAALDLVARQIRLDGTLIPLGAEEVVLAADEVYLSSPRVADLLEATVEVDWSALTIFLSRQLPFPAQQQLSIQARREVELARAAYSAQASHEPLPYYPRTGGAVLEWGISSTSTDPVRHSVLHSQLGLALWGGQLTTGGTLAAGQKGGEAWLSRYHRAFPGSRLVRQVQIGDLVTEGLRARPIRGFSITNAPFVRGVLFDDIRIAPDIPHGWEYEVYQGGRLLGFSEAATRTPVAVPLQYGSTPIQVRMYGPAGEEITSDLLYWIPVSQLPAGQWQYAAGGGTCPQQQCELFAYGDLRHGATRWLTLGAGAEHLRDSLYNEVRPYGVATMAPGLGWIAELSAARSSFYRGLLQYLGTGRTSGSLAAGITYPGAGQASYIPVTTRRWHAETSLATALPQFTSPFQSIRLETRLEGPIGEEIDRWRVSAFTSFRRGYLETGYESSHFQSSDLLNVRYTFVTPERWPAWLRNSALSAGVGLNDSGLQLVEASASLQPRPLASLQVTGRWHAQGRLPTLSIGYGTSFGAAHTQSRVATSPDGRLNASFLANGALTYDRRAGVVPLPRGGTGSAGVSGAVFYDHDGDGRLGPGDEMVAGVQVMVGGLRAWTDGHGTYHTWSVIPYEITSVRVDTLKLSDPSWTPLQRETLIRPSPHLYNRVDIPLVPTRELSGRLVPGEGVRTTGGVTLELIELSTGAIQKVVTFSDGEFYISRLRPGGYELRTAESSLRALRARAEPERVRFAISAKGDEVLVELEPITLINAPD